jgi:hypothetical protein
MAFPRIIWTQRALSDLDVIKQRGGTDSDIVGLKDKVRTWVFSNVESWKVDERIPHSFPWTYNVLVTVEKLAPESGVDQVEVVACVLP